MYGDQADRLKELLPEKEMGRLQKVLNMVILLLNIRVNL